MADQPDPLLLRVEPGFGLLEREHVLPDRVARRGVEEADPVRGSACGSSPRRNSRVSPPAVRPRPLDRRRRRLGEGGDVELAEHREVVVADQADVAALADQLVQASGSAP